MRTAPPQSDQTVSYTLLARFLPLCVLCVPLREALIRVPLREDGASESRAKALLQVRVTTESGLDFRETIAGG